MEFNMIHSNFELNQNICTDTLLREIQNAATLTLLQSKRHEKLIHNTKSGTKIGPMRLSYLNRIYYIGCTIVSLSSKKVGDGDGDEDETSHSQILNRVYKKVLYAGLYMI